MQKAHHQFNMTWPFCLKGLVVLLSLHAEIMAAMVTLSGLKRANLAFVVINAAV